MSKFALATIALACAAAAPLSAQAQAMDAGGPFMMRVRAVYIDPANRDDTNLGLGLGVSTKTIPEVDFSYFITPNIATELILTYPQGLDVTSNGSKVGSLKALPPTLTLQYHFAPNSSFRPYVGAGLNFTNYSSVSLPPGVTLSSNSTGWAVQAGADIEIGKNLYLNVDVKKVAMSTGVYVSGASHGTLNVDPVLIGVGVGFHF